MRGVRFEWDERKNELNIQKHEIDFADAKDIFNETLITNLDTRKHYGEERWVALGRLKGIVVVVVYTFRGDKIRIISIRKGNKRDRENYRKKIKEI